MEKLNLPNGIQINNGKMVDASLAPPIIFIDDEVNKTMKVSCADTYWLSIQGTGIETQQFWGDYWHTEKGEKIRLFPRVAGKTLEEVVSKLQESINKIKKINK